MIIIVIHTPLARLTTLICRPFAYILLTYYIFLITLNVTCTSHCFIFTFHTLNVQPLPLQARLVMPRALNLQFKQLHITFPEEKA